MSEETEKRDWVGEAVKCFIAVEGLDPTDPVSAIQAHFDRTATDELKAECAANGKTAAKCWKFIEAVARRALNGRSGHIDPTAVYAIAMHWFQDVPLDWDRKPSAKTAADNGQTEANGYRSNDPEDVAAARRADELAIQKRVEDGITEIPESMLEKPWCDELAKKYNLSKPKNVDNSSKRAAKQKKTAKPKKKDHQGFFFDLLETKEEVADAPAEA